MNIKRWWKSQWVQRTAVWGSLWGLKLGSCTSPAVRIQVSESLPTVCLVDHASQSKGGRLSVGEHRRPLVLYLCSVLLAICIHFSIKPFILRPAGFHPSACGFGAGWVTGPTLGGLSLTLRKGLLWWGERGHGTQLSVFIFPPHIAEVWVCLF